MWKSKRRWVTRILDNRSIVQRDESVIKALVHSPSPHPASYIKVIIIAWTRAGLSNEPGRRIIWFNRVHQPRCPVLFHPGGGSRIVKPFDLAALIRGILIKPMCNDLCSRSLRPRNNVQLRISRIEIHVHRGKFVPFCSILSSKFWRGSLNLENFDKRFRIRI